MPRSTQKDRGVFSQYSSQPQPPKKVNKVSHNNKKISHHHHPSNAQATNEIIMYENPMTNPFVDASSPLNDSPEAVNPSPAPPAPAPAHHHNTILSSNANHNTQIQNTAEPLFPGVGTSHDHHTAAADQSADVLVVQPRWNTTEHIRSVAVSRMEHLLLLLLSELRSHQYNTQGGGHACAHRSARENTWSKYFRATGTERASATNGHSECRGQKKAVLGQVRRLCDGSVLLQTLVELHKRLMDKTASIDGIISSASAAPGSVGTIRDIYYCVSQSVSWTVQLLSEAHELSVLFATATTASTADGTSSSPLVVPQHSSSHPQLSTTTVMTPLAFAYGGGPSQSQQIQTQQQTQTQSQSQTLVSKESVGKHVYRRIYSAIHMLCRLTGLSRHQLGDIVASSRGLMAAGPGALRIDLQDISQLPCPIPGQWAALQDAVEGFKKASTADRATWAARDFTKTQQMGPGSLGQTQAPIPISSQAAMPPIPVPVVVPFDEPPFSEPHGYADHNSFSLTDHQYPTELIHPQQLLQSQFQRQPHSQPSYPPPQFHAATGSGGNGLCNAFGLPVHDETDEVFQPNEHEPHWIPMMESHNEHVVVYEDDDDHADDATFSGWGHHEGFVPPTAGCGALTQTQHGTQITAMAADLPHGAHSLVAAAYAEFLFSYTNYDSMLHEQQQQQEHSTFDSLPRKIDASGASCVIIVEKESVFNDLVTGDIFHRFPGCVLITGRGMPDLATRCFVSFFSLLYPLLPFYAFCDHNASGLAILCQYKYGGISRITDNLIKECLEQSTGKVVHINNKTQQKHNNYLLSNTTSVPGLKWIGLHSHDITTTTTTTTTAMFSSSSMMGATNTRGNTNQHQQHQQHHHQYAQHQQQLLRSNTSRDRAILNNIVSKLQQGIDEIDAYSQRKESKRIKQKEREKENAFMIDHDHHGALKRKKRKIGGEDGDGGGITQQTQQPAPLSSQTCSHPFAESARCWVHEAKKMLSHGYNADIEAVESFSAAGRRTSITDLLVKKLLDEDFF